MTILDTAAPGVCWCGRIASEPHACEERPATAIDPTKVPCPCCGELPWCPTEQAKSYAEAMAAPEFVMGRATYTGWWD